VGVVHQVPVGLNT